MNRSTNSEIRRTAGFTIASKAQSANDFASLAMCRKIDYLPVIASYRCGRALMKSCSFDSEEEFRVKLNEELTRNSNSTGSRTETKDSSALERFARYLQQKDPINLGDIDLFREWTEWLALVRSGSSLVQHSAETCLTIAVPEVYTYLSAFPAA